MREGERIKDVCVWRWRGREVRGEKRGEDQGRVCMAVEGG